MHPYRLLTLLSLLVLAGGGRASAQEAVSRMDTLRIPTGPEAELQERWRSPFAVESVGEVAPRPPRAAVVRLEPDTARRRSARPDTATAVAPPDTASARSPARAGRSDSARVASRPARRDSAATTPAARSTTSAPRGGSARTHRVAAGETFFGVARRYSVTPTALRAANPGVDPEGLRTGTVLRIPSGSGSASATAATTGPKKPAASGTTARTGARRTHRVVRGDTLYGIARKYGVRAAEIRAANKLDSDTVEIGQTLVIPGGG